MSLPLPPFAPLYSPHNRHRPPDWRWQRVLELCEVDPPRRWADSDDISVRQAVQAFDRVRAIDPPPSGPGEDGPDDPALLEAIAWTLAAERTGTPESGTYHALLARFLAGLTNEEIARLSGHPIEVVVWFERLLFDMRDRLPYHDWVFAYVFLPGMERVSQWRAARPNEVPIYPDPSVRLEVAFEYDREFYLELYERDVRMNRMTPRELERHMLFERAMRAIGLATQSPSGKWALIRMAVSILRDGDGPVRPPDTSSDDVIEAMLREVRIMSGGPSTAPSPVPPHDPRLAKTKRGHTGNRPPVPPRVPRGAGAK